MTGVFDWIGTGMLTILGFVFLLFAIVGQFEFFGGLKAYKSAEGQVPIWDRLIAGTLGTLFISLDAYRVVSKLIQSSSSLLPKASAAAITVAMSLYLFALWWHDKNEDLATNKVREQIRILLFIMLFIPLVFLIFLVFASPS